MKSTRILEYLLNFLSGASWGLFVLWILFPPIHISLNPLLNSFFGGVLAFALVLLAQYALRKNEIRNNK